MTPIEKHSCILILWNFVIEWKVKLAGNYGLKTIARKINNHSLIQINIKYKKICIILILFFSDV